MKTTVGLSLVVMGLLVGAVQAEGLLGKNYLDLAGGIHKYTGDSSFDTGWTGQLQANLNLEANLDLQLGASYLSTGGAFSSGESYDYEVYTLSSGIVMFGDPTPDHLRPYLTAGVGRVEMDRSKTQVTDTTDTSLDIGVGVEWELTDELISQVGIGLVKLDDNETGQADIMLGYWLKHNTLINFQSNVRFGGDEGRDTDFATFLLGVSMLFN